MRKQAALIGAVFVLVSTLCYARGIHRTPPSNSPYPPGVTVPAVAAQWGFTNLILYDDFSDASTVDWGNQRIPGFKWYLNNRFQLVSSDFGAWRTAVPEPNDPGYITHFKGGLQFLNVPLTTSSVDVLSNCYTNPNAGALSGTVTGLSWTGGFYMQATYQIENTTHSLAGFWPAFFTGGQVEFGNGDYNSGGILAGFESVEEDIVENVPLDNPGHVGLPLTTNNIHHWIFTTGENDLLLHGNNNDTPDLSLPHSWGLLQVPDSLTTTGLAFTHWVLDGTDNGGITYSASTVPNPALIPNNGVGFLTRTLVEHHCAMIATGRNWPMTLTNIQVWQRP